MSSVRTGSRVRCECCGEAFLRLSNHLNWKARCAAFYNSLPKVLPIGFVDDMHIPADATYLTMKVIPLVQDILEKVLGVLQQLTHQLMIITMKGTMKTLV